MNKFKRQINLFYIPALIVLAIFVAFPLFEAFRMSFMKWNGYSQKTAFIGLKNYTRMFKDAHFTTAFFNTLLYGVGSTLLQNVFGLLFALFLNKRFHGYSFVRAVIYMPVMISGLIMGYVLGFFTQYDGGVFNEIMALLGRDPVYWMGDPMRARMLITIVNSWQFVGVAMMIYVAGLTGIPSVYYEAASIEGVTGLQAFRYITLPLLIPAISSAVIINLIGGLKLFDVIMSLSGGGPNYSTHSLCSYISNQYFYAEKGGYSAAIGVFTFFFIMLVSGIVNRYLASKEVEA